MGGAGRGEQLVPGGPPVGRGGKPPSPVLTPGCWMSASSCPLAARLAPSEPVTSIVHLSLCASRSRLGPLLWKGLLLWNAMALSLNQGKQQSNTIRGEILIHSRCPPTSVAHRILHTHPCDTLPWSVWGPSRAHPLPSLVGTEASGGGPCPHQTPHPTNKS